MKNVTRVVRFPPIPTRHPFTTERRNTQLQNNGAPDGAAYSRRYRRAQHRAPHKRITSAEGFLTGTERQ